MGYLSFVFQDAVLFNDAIYNNIRIGNMNAARAQVLAAAKVTRSALTNAASVAAMVLTTESLAADKPDPQADAAANAAAMAAAQGGGMY